MARRQRGPQVRRVTKNEERRRPGIFISLKDQEKFIGHALFEPDAELENNPGYYEYFSHFDPSGPATVPCLGEDCLMCERGDQPRTKALTLWFMPDEPADSRLKVFTANSGTVEDMVDEAEDLGGLLGRKYRVKRRGQRENTRYRLTSMNETLPKKEVQAILKDVEIDLEDIIQKQALKQWERLKAVEALEEDDDLEDVEEDDDEEEDEKPPKSKSKRGKEVKDEDEDEDEDEEPEDEDEDTQEFDPIEDEEYKLVSVSKAKNYIKVEHDGEVVRMDADDDTSVDGFKKGDSAVISAEWDADDEMWYLTAIEEPSEEEPEEDEDEPEEDEDEDAEEETVIEGRAVTVVSVNEDEEIFTVEDTEGELGKIQVFLPEGIDLDFDDYSKGTKLKINAALDDEGDWVLTEEPEIQKARTTRKRTAKK